MENQTLHKALQLACQPTHAGKICQGRQQILSMDRALVLNTIERVAQKALNLTDYWEYRRFLEMCEMLDASLVQRVAQWGITQSDEDIRDAARDFLLRPLRKG